MARRLYRRRRQRRQANVGELDELLENALDREEARLVGHPLQVKLALFVEIFELDDGGPRIGVQIIAQMTCGLDAADRRAEHG